jgi:LmbE family N-acetylglucosaminyl deacetylase
MPTTPIALAVAAHPDDIEFCMAGTLLLLQKEGWQTHYLNLAGGQCGSVQHNASRTRLIRRKEAKKAAALLGCKFHPPFLNDLQIFYEDTSLRRLAALIRTIAPSILLTHSPQDYMEDHMTTARLVVTATFARGMPNYRTLPAQRPTDRPVTIYHAMPHGLCDGLRRVILPGQFVDTSSVHDQKHAGLACHASQKHWLDQSQGMDSYLHAMDEMSLAVGRMSGRFKHAEGWRRHSHLGFGPADADPLQVALGRTCWVNPNYEVALQAGSYG